MSLEGWEGFVVIEDKNEKDGGWVLCYDRDGDKLKSVRGDRTVLEVELDRVIQQ